MDKEKGDMSPFHTGICGHYIHTEGEQKMPPQNMTFWYKDDLKLISFKKQHTQEKVWNLRSYPFVRPSPSLYQEEKDDSKSWETLINKEDTYLNMHNNLTPVFIVPFLVPSHNYTHTPTYSFVF